MTHRTRVPQYKFMLLRARSAGVARPHGVRRHQRTARHRTFGELAAASETSRHPDSGQHTAFRSIELTYDNTIT